jgi:hypothetical protein
MDQGFLKESGEGRWGRFAGREKRRRDGGRGNSQAFLGCVGLTARSKAEASSRRPTPRLIFAELVDNKTFQNPRLLLRHGPAGRRDPCPSSGKSRRTTAGLAESKPVRTNCAALCSKLCPTAESIGSIASLTLKPRIEAAELLIVDVEGWNDSVQEFGKLFAINLLHSSVILYFASCGAMRLVLSHVGVGEGAGIESERRSDKICIGAGLQARLSPAPLSILSRA